MDDIVPILKNALDQQKFTASDQQTITVIEVRRNDYIGDNAEGSTTIASRRRLS